MCVPRGGTGGSRISLICKGHTGGGLLTISARSVRIALACFARNPVGTTPRRIVPKSSPKRSTVDSRRVALSFSSRSGNCAAKLRDGQSTASVAPVRAREAPSHAVSTPPLTAARRAIVFLTSLPREMRRGRTASHREYRSSREDDRGVPEKGGRHARRDRALQ